MSSITTKESFDTTTSSNFNFLKSKKKNKPILSSKMKLPSNLAVFLPLLLAVLPGPALADTLDPFAANGADSIDSNTMPNDNSYRALGPRSVKELPCSQYKWGSGGILNCCESLDKKRKPFSIGVNCKYT